MPHAPSVRGTEWQLPLTALPRSHRAATRAEEGVPRSRTPPRTESEACAADRGRRRRPRTPEDRASHDTCPLITCPPVPAGRRAEQDICLHWLVSLLIVLKLVLGWTALLQALSKVVQVVKVVTPLPPPPTTKPLTPYSPYDALPGVSRFRGTPTPPSLSLSPGWGHDREDRGERLQEVVRERDFMRAVPTEQPLVFFTPGYPIDVAEGMHSNG